MKCENCNDEILDYCGHCIHIFATMHTLPYCKKLRKHYLRRINRKRDCVYFEDRGLEKKKKKKKQDTTKKGEKKGHIKGHISDHDTNIHQGISDATGWDI
jgi:hypothetical protein